MAAANPPLQEDGLRLIHSELFDQRAELNGLALVFINMKHQSTVVVIDGDLRNPVPIAMKEPKRVCRLVLKKRASSPYRRFEGATHLGAILDPIPILSAEETFKAEGKR